MAKSRLPDSQLALDALAAKAKDELARRDLPTYVEAVHDFCTYPHMQQWADALMDESSGNLLIISPPGHAKSNWISIFHSCWYIGRHPENHVILLSNTISQAERFSVSVRDTVSSNSNYARIFPTVKLDAVKGMSQKEWFVRRKDTGDPHATMLASGVPGPILGARADLLIMDDVCVLPNTPILTSKGLKVAAAICAGDTVLGSDGKWNKVLSKVERQVDEEIVDVRPYYSHYTYSVTSNHPILTVRGTARRVSSARGRASAWTRADQLRKRDYLCMPRPAFEATNLQAVWDSMQQISVAVGQHVGLEQNFYLDKPDFWRLVGYWVAEGSCQNGERNTINFSFNENELEFHADIERLANVVLNRRACVCFDRARHAASVTLSDKRLATLLKTFYVLGKKSLPSWVLGVNDICLREFLRGYFRGDGTKSVREGYTATTSSPSLAYQIQLIGLKLGLLGGVAEDDSITTFKGSGPCYKIRFGPEFGRLVFGGNAKSRYLYGIVEDSRILVPIRSLGRRFYKGPVINFTVEGSHSYCGPMLTSHNCDSENTATGDQRTKLREWIKNTAFSRLVKTGRAICVMTRWNEEDLAAEFLNDSAWTIIHMPAIGYWGPEKPLCPEIMPLDNLLAIKNNPRGGRLRFENMYQGNPTIPEGYLIKRAWWKKIPEAQLPPPTEWEIVIQAWDTAFKTGEENDYCVCLTMARYKGNIFILRMFRKKMEYPELLKMSRELFTKSDPKPRLVLVEDKASGQSLLQSLRTTVSPTIPVMGFKADSDPVARVNAFTGYVETGRVWLPEGPTSDWVEDFLNDLSGFPTAAHDDATMAWVGGMQYLTAGDKFERLDSGVLVSTERPGEEAVPDDWSELPGAGSLAEFLRELN